MTNIFESSFGQTAFGQTRLFRLENEYLTVLLTDFGASVVGIFVRGGDGRPKCAALGYDSASGYASGGAFLGATVGRFAGRIGGARFRLGEREIRLIANDGENHLHGGWSKRIWSAQELKGGVSFSLFSPDGDEGFPGGVSVRADFELDGRTLRLAYEARTDAPTHLNLTNHTYFNLDGGGSVEDHLLRVNADAYAEVGPGLIPTGRLRLLKGSALDFTSPRRLEEAILDPELRATRGLDHSFILRGEPGTLREAARLSSESSGLTLVCRTTRPTVHVYTAGFLDGDPGGFPRFGGVCLETQHLPDSPNKPCFPPTLLLPGEEYSEATEFEFFTAK